MPVLVLHQRRAGIALRTRDYALPHLVEIGGRHRLRECQLLRKYGRNTDLAWLDVDVRGDDGPRRIIDSLALRRILFSDTLDVGAQ
jgi:hypothetical protein